jgi:hypothetical protein
VKLNCPRILPSVRGVEAGRVPKHARMNENSSWLAVVSRRILLPHFEELQIARCPFNDLPERSEGHWGEDLTAAKMDMCHWLDPFLVARTEFIVHSDGFTSFQTHLAAGECTGWCERGPFSVDHPIWRMLRHPFEHMIAIAQLICSGLLDRHPDLNPKTSVGHQT